MSSQQLEVHIMGQSYLLKCPTGGEAQFQTAVHKLSLIHISEPTRPY